MEAIILAGGMGTRLRKIISDIPKPMAPVGDKPFLYYIFDWFRKYPVEKVIISAGYKAYSIKEYFGNSVFNIPLEYAIEEKPLGTGGAVKFVSEKITGKNVLILNGDTWFPVDINKFFEFHTKTKGLFSLALKRIYDFDRYGTVVLEGDDILQFKEKKFCREGLINGGIYISERKYIDSWNMPEMFSLEKDILEKAAGKSLLKGMIFDDPFLDIGIPEDYSKANTIIIGKR